MVVTTKKEPGGVGEIAFTVQVFREGKLFVAHAPELDVSSAGETVEKAKAHLLEAVEAFLEESPADGDNDRHPRGSRLRANARRLEGP